ncbi:helix-turn-helix transcriptional regulator [Methanobacterium sp. ACI-7]|uniref:helix-turn-helix transcriptional regulator n=1 Tax=unclassified Methanobacterium TaxID=2627676 RepID=UPI0039C37362
MPLDADLKIYGEVKDILKFNAISAVRIKIMISLFYKSQKTKDLREITGIQSSSILHGVNDLEKEGIVVRRGDDFYLSEMGKIWVPQLINIIKTQYVLKKFHKLWLNHTIESIPQDLLNEIGDLNNSQLLESESTDVYKVHENHIHVVMNSKEVKGVSPIFYPNYPEIFRGLIERDINVELVLTDDVFKKTIESLDQGIEDLKKLISTGNLNLWILNEEAKIAFTLTDKFMTMGLFSVDGMYDTTKNLVSDHIDTITWGKKLFEYYRQRADKFEL